MNEKADFGLGDFVDMESLHEKAVQTAVWIQALAVEMRHSIVRGQSAADAGDETVMHEQYGEANGLWVAIRKLAKGLADRSMQSRQIVNRQSSIVNC